MVQVIILRIILLFLGPGSKTWSWSVCEHALEKVKVAFDLLHSAIIPDSPGIKGSAVNLPPAQGGCEKGKVSFLGSPVYTVANSQAERGEIILHSTPLHFFLPSLPWPSINSYID